MLFAHLAVSTASSTHKTVLLIYNKDIPGPDARRDTVKWIRGEIEQSSGLTDTVSTI
jgi:hypothetical protein